MSEGHSIHKLHDRRPDPTPPTKKRSRKPPPPAGAPGWGSAAPFHRLGGHLPARGLPTLPPAPQPPIAARPLQHGHPPPPRRRPAHPAPFASLRHTPIVELLHPIARDPEPR